MRWTHLGHAGWWVEAGSQALLLDPLLGETHHDGVFEVFPRRAIDVDALDARVVIVSHRHPDHFDVGSLAALARRDPERALLTADPLVAEAGRRLGFRWTRVLPAGAWLDLDGVHLLPTPSHCDVVEWGVLIGTSDGAVFNQIDSELRGPDEVIRLVRGALRHLGRPERRLELALARWNPIRQAEAALGKALGFQVDAWSAELQRAAAMEAVALVPGACGSRYVGDGAWQNGLVFPGTEARFLRDLSALAPGTRGIPSGPGRSWEVRDGAVQEGPTAPFVHLLDDAPDDRVLGPVVVPPVTDDDPTDLAARRARVDRWVHDILAPAVSHRAGDPPTRLALEVVWVDGADAWTLTVGPGGVGVARGLDPEYDARNTLAGSVLCRVLDGVSPWGRALLGGTLRAVDRRYSVTGGVVRRRADNPLFVYDALPYARAFERWIEHELQRHGA